MIESPMGFILIAVIGGLCALDTVSVLQAMIARPIVSSTIAGAVLGRAEDGIVIGAVLELFALETLPFGASRYPEWGSAGVVAGATYITGGPGMAGALALATLAGLATAALGSASMVWHRRFVGRMAAQLRAEMDAGSDRAVARLHAAGIASDLWRGACVTAFALAVSLLLTGRLLAAWRLGYGPSVAWPVTLGVAAAGAAIFGAARMVPRALWYFVGGAAVGLALVMVR